MNTNEQRELDDASAGSIVNEEEVVEATGDDTTMVKEKTMTTQQNKGERKEEKKEEQEEEGDECPICLEILPTDASKFNRFTCCGNGIHPHCSKDMHSMKMGHHCPFCRAKTPTSHEEQVKYIRPWVKKKKAWAQTLLGQKYRDGRGVKQSYKMAKMLYEQAAQQGYTSAMNQLGAMYH